MICSLWRIFRHDEDDDDDDNDEEENGEVFAMHLYPYVSVWPLEKSSGSVLPKPMVDVSMTAFISY